MHTKRGLEEDGEGVAVFLDDRDRGGCVGKKAATGAGVTVGWKCLVWGFVGKDGWRALFNKGIVI